MTLAREKAILRKLNCTREELRESAQQKVFEKQIHHLQDLLAQSEAEEKEKPKRAERHNTQKISTKVDKDVADETSVIQRREKKDKDRDMDKEKEFIVPSESESDDSEDEYEHQPEDSAGEAIQKYDEYSGSSDSDGNEEREETKSTKQLKANQQDNSRRQAEELRAKYTNDPIELELARIKREQKAFAERVADRLKEVQKNKARREKESFYTTYNA